MTETTALLPPAPNAEDVPALVSRLDAQGCSRFTIASALNSLGLLTPQGRRWHASSVQRLLRDLANRR